MTYRQIILTILIFLFSSQSQSAIIEITQTKSFNQNDGFARLFHFDKMDYSGALISADLRLESIATSGLDMRGSQNTTDNDGAYSVTGMARVNRLMQSSLVSPSDAVTFETAHTASCSGSNVTNASCDALDITGPNSQLNYDFSASELGTTADMIGGGSFTLSMDSVLSVPSFSEQINAQGTGYIEANWRGSFILSYIVDCGGLCPMSQSGGTTAIRDITATYEVPEPSTLGLLLLGISGLVLRSRRPAR